MQRNASLHSADRQTDTPGSRPDSPPSPTDSGYASASPPSSEPREPVDENGRPLADYDGVQPDLDDPFVVSGNEGTPRVDGPVSFTAPSTPRTPVSFQREMAALPKPHIRSQQALRSPFYPGLAPRFQKKALGTSSLRFPDRFISARPYGANLSERFKTNKAPEELTATERLLRHSGASEDAFCYRRRIVTLLSPDFRQQSRSESAASRNRVGTVLGPLDQNSIDGNDGEFTNSTVWTVGLGGTAVDNGRGQLIRSGTNAPLYRATFPTMKPKTEEDLEKHADRLAVALGLDRAERVLDVNSSPYREGSSARDGRNARTQWNGTQWVNDGPIHTPPKPLGNRTLPTAPFKVLDAPGLRDDFYCSILAYSPTCQTLAVGLGNLLYGWSETRGVQLLNADPNGDCHLTSVSFSSSEGCKAILAFGRSNRTLSLMSLYDDANLARSNSPPTPRFEVVQPAPVSCLSWKPVCTVRPSKSMIHLNAPVKNEDLLVGDESGHIYYYAVEWPERWEVERHNWAGEMTLLARIAVHTQQICGLAWSRNGETFGSGGNDNLCCLFETDKVLNGSSKTRGTAAAAQANHPTLDPADTEVLINRPSLTPAETGRDELHHEAPPPSDYETSAPSARHITSGAEEHRWVHGAAVKAIAFCPWQENLVATGGGSNDKCIHFFHTRSGAALASISVSAQVTSLVWSTTRREIAATFGYAQPEHPIRIAVFSWPECSQVAVIPWAGEHRALYAIPYPGGPPQPPHQKHRGREPVPGAARTSRRGGSAGSVHSAESRKRAEDRDRRAYGRRHSSGPRSRTEMEGCIIVASSDKSVKFHEVWAADPKATTVIGPGILGGSDILESLEGVEWEGPVIR